MNRRTGETRLSIIGRAVMLFIVSLVAVTAGCERREHIKPSGPAETVRMGIASQLLSAPVIIAIEKGYFKDEGLNVIVKEYDFGRLCLESLFAGEVDLATVAQMPLVVNSFKRDDFAVIASFCHSFNDSKIIIRKDKGFKTGADFKGKTIGTPFGTSAHYYVDVYLNNSHLSLRDTKTVNIPAKELPAALHDGKVAAISVFEPYAYEAMKLLPNIAERVPQIEIFKEAFNLVAMKAYSREHPEILKRVLRAVDRAENFLRLNKDEAMAMLAIKLKVEERFVTQEWGGYAFELSLDQSLVSILEDQARWAIRNKLADKTDIPNYLKFISPEALREVKPEAMTLIMPSGTR